MCGLSSAQLPEFASGPPRQGVLAASTTQPCLQPADYLRTRCCLQAGSSISSSARGRTQTHLPLRVSALCDATPAFGCTLLTCQSCPLPNRQPERLPPQLCPWRLISEIAAVRLELPAELPRPTPLCQRGKLRHGAEKRLTHGQAGSPWWKR